MANKKSPGAESSRISPPVILPPVAHPLRDDFSEKRGDDFAPNVVLWEDLVSIEPAGEDAEGMDLAGKAVPVAAADVVDFFDDPIHLYLREIGKVGLLTAIEERSLAGKVDDSRYLAG